MSFTPKSSSSGFSPPIDITLEVDGHVYPVEEVGRDYIVVTRTRVAGPINGILTICVDGQPSTRQISLPLGIDPTVEQTSIITTRAAVLAPQTRTA